MRVITGTARGRRLETPDGRDIRPTPERVKEGLFSSLQFDIEGRRVLDLFAGSGQLGIEALSRGAKNVVFVDSSADAIRIVQNNIKNTGFENSSRIVKSDYQSFTAMSNDIFDIVFLDPPYQAGILMPALKACLPLLSDYGMVVCEHPNDVKVLDEVGGFKIYRTYKYGKVLMTVYKKEEK